jgi:hypothetical protein
MKIMGDIYENASEVIIWLGGEEADADGEIAIDLLEDLCKSFTDFLEGDERGKKE